MKEQILAYMREHNLSQSAFARKIMVSESTMSQYMSGKYPNPETVELKVKDLLEKDQLRQQVSDVQDIAFAMTSIAMNVISTLEYARLKRTITVIYGDAGVGKTRALEEWSNGKSDVHVLTAAPALSNPKSFFKYLARELKTVRGGHIDDLYMDICDRLKGSDKVIIIDEAQHLTLKTLENLRGIQETAGIALVLIGNETIYTKMVGRQQAEFAQLFSRIGWRKHLLTDQFILDDVQKVFGAHLEKEAANMLLDICHSKYGLRGAVFVYVNAANNSDVTAKGIRAMAQTMGIRAKGSAVAG